jgi:hypothetical protein
MRQAMENVEEESEHNAEYNQGEEIASSNAR